MILETLHLSQKSNNHTLNIKDDNIFKNLKRRCPGPRDCIPRSKELSWLPHFMALPNEMKLEILQYLSIQELMNVYIEAESELGEFIVNIAFMNNYGFKKIFRKKINIVKENKQIENNIAALGE